MKNLFYRNSQLIKLILSAVFVAMASGGASGAVFTVTKTADTNDGVCNADCSLREAVAEANAASTSDIINFDSSVFSSPRSITLTGGQMNIAASGSATINGPGANLLTISGNNQSRIFFINQGADVFISNAKLTGGSVSFESGGAIQNAGTLNVMNLTLSGNTTSLFGSAIGNIDNAVAFINNSNISGNSGGSAISNYRGTMTVNDSIISSNTASGVNNIDGTLTLNNTTVSNNISGDGGGIINDGTMNLNYCVVANNTAIYNFGNGDGGGIYNSDVLNVNNSVIYGNTSQDDGGGIATPSASINIINSTISNNTARNRGGGIYHENIGVVSLINATIANNTADSDNNGTGSGGGVKIGFPGPATVRNTIIADNIDNTGSSPDFSGALTSQGYNLIESLSGTLIVGTTVGNILGRDPQLLPLRNNGGITNTLALQANSPAIDAADPNNVLPTDQRGNIRPQDGNLDGNFQPDIGAYERQAATIFTVTKTADTNDGVCDLDCSLREAITASNTAATQDNAIIFSPAIFGTPQTISLTNGQLNIINNGAPAINGPGINLLMISGNNLSRIFSVNTGAAVSINNLTLANGSETASAAIGGGAVYNQGNFSLLNVKLNSNHASGSGGGIYNFGGKTTGIAVNLAGNDSERGGGGIFNEQGTFILDDSSVSGNNAVNDGGGIRNVSGTLLVINSSVSTNHVSTDGGGGIYNYGGKVSIFASNINDNTAQSYGGGMSNDGGGTLSAFNMTVRGNSSNLSGGGVSNSGGVLTFNNSAFIENSAHFGGGIRNFYNQVTPASVTLFNSTVSDNNVQNDGGGLYNVDGTISLTNSTVASNSANSGGGVINQINGVVNSRNTIFADNSASSGVDFLGTLNSQGYNLIENTSGATISGITTGNITGVDPMLGPLRDNGGSTFTRALLGRSAAVDAADPSNVQATDQRGVTRPRDGDNNGSFRADIGALERTAASRTPFDFDGDQKSDISIFRPAAGEWWYLKSTNGGNAAFQFGNSSDKIVPADFTGDRRADIAVFRPSTGEWFVLRSENNSYYSFPFGVSGDIPVAGDFDADGKSDPTIFRPSTATWFISLSSGGTAIQQFGQAGDVPVVADYDGDGYSDISIFRPSVGEWWLQRSNLGTIVFQFGNSNDKPVQGNYTGDGKADVAIWRPSTGEWFILRSEDNGYYSFPFGTTGDIPAPGDFDGDGKFDATVFRPSQATWYVQRTTAGTLIRQFGLSTDMPVPNAFVP